MALRAKKDRFPPVSGPGRGMLRGKTGREWKKDGLTTPEDTFIIMRTEQTARAVSSAREKTKNTGRWSGRERRVYYQPKKSADDPHPPPDGQPILPPGTGAVPGGWGKAAGGGAEVARTFRDRGADGGR